MKTLIVREAFGLDGKDYSRGDEIANPAEITKVLETHANHVHATPYEADAPVNEPAPAPEKQDSEQDDLRSH